MTNFLFRMIATCYHSSLPLQQIQQPNFNFTASDKFIRQFRKRHKFSVRRAHLKRRPDIDEATIQNFRHEFEEKVKKYDSNHILNADETFWRLNEFNLNPEQITSLLIVDQMKKKDLPHLQQLVLIIKNIPLFILPKGYLKGLKAIGF